MNDPNKLPESVPRGTAADLRARAEAIAIQLAVHAFPESPERTGRAIALAKEVAEAVLALLRPERPAGDMEHVCDCGDAMVPHLVHRCLGCDKEVWEEFASLPGPPPALRSVSPGGVTEQEDTKDLSRVDSVPEGAHGDLPRRATE